MSRLGRRRVKDRPQLYRSLLLASMMPKKMCRQLHPRERRYECAKSRTLRGIGRRTSIFEVDLRPSSTMPPIHAAMYYSAKVRSIASSASSGMGRWILQNGEPSRPAGNLTVAVYCQGKHEGEERQQLEWKAIDSGGH
jgi:hypothetical protein